MTPEELAQEIWDDFHGDGKRVVEVKECDHPLEILLVFDDGSSVKLIGLGVPEIKQSMKGN